MAERKAGTQNVKRRRPRKVVERNIRLLDHFMRYALAHPEVLDKLPADFELVILPDDDSEVRRYNLDLLSQYGSQGNPVVFVRLAATQGADLQQMRPAVYVPLAV